MRKHFTFNNDSLIYSSRIILGLLIVWFSLPHIEDSKKIWAMISVIVITEPDFESVRTATLSRIVNTIMGGILGLTFMYVGLINILGMMCAITLSVIIGTSFKSYPVSWKLAPTTVVILMLPSIVEHSTWKDAMGIALDRSLEILFGSVVAYSLGYIFMKLKHWKDKGIFPDDNPSP